MPPHLNEGRCGQAPLHVVYVTHPWTLALRLRNESETCKSQGLVLLFCAVGAPCCPSYLAFTCCSVSTVGLVQQIKVFSPEKGAQWKRKITTLPSRQNTLCCRRRADGSPWQREHVMDCEMRSYPGLSPWIQCPSVSPDQQRAFPGWKQRGSHSRRERGLKCDRHTCCCRLEVTGTHPR